MKDLTRVSLLSWMIIPCSCSEESRWLAIGYNSCLAHCGLWGCLNTTTVLEFKSGVLLAQKAHAVRLGSQLGGLVLS